jgi:hypothetical protein
MTASEPKRSTGDFSLTSAAGPYMTNSIRPLFAHTINRLILGPDPAQKLSSQISVELVGSEEVFGRYADGIISQPL